MQIIYSEKINDMIEKYNKKGSEESDYKTLVHRLILHLVMNKEPGNPKKTRKIEEYIKKYNLLKCLENWLILHDIYTISFDKIIGVPMEQEIHNKNGENYSGFAFQYDEIFYVFFIEDTNMEKTISIIAHEIIHVETENIWNRMERERGIKVCEQMQEELVTLLEHLFLIEENGIIPFDLSIEKTRLLQKLLRQGIEKSIVYWKENMEYGNIVKG